jgi:hypothetical protein
LDAALALPDDVLAADVDPDAASLAGVTAVELLTIWLIFTGVSEERVHPTSHIGQPPPKL